MKFSESLERATTRRDGPAVHRWSDEEFKQQRDLDLQIESISTRQVLVAVGLCMLTAALLTSGTLIESAERRTFGGQRDALVAIARPLDRVANFLSLNRPADAVAELRNGPTVPLVDPLVDGIDARPSEAATDSPSADQLPSVDNAPALDIPPEPLRTVTNEAPLLVHVAGDSQAEYPGQALTNRSVNGKLSYEVSADSRIATGLARPDYFNWPAELQNVDDDVEAVVLFFGGNDFQDMELSGERLVRGTNEWFVEYQRRVEITLDVLKASDRQVFWVAPPPVRDSETSAAVVAINEGVRSAANERDWVTVIAADERFAPDGAFLPYLPDDAGVETRVRSGDGVHFTAKGASWVADMIVEEIGKYWAVS